MKDTSEKRLFHEEGLKKCGNVKMWKSGNESELTNGFSDSFPRFFLCNIP